MTIRQMKRIPLPQPLGRPEQDLQLTGKINQLRLRGKLDTRWLCHSILLHFKRSLLQVPRQMVNVASVQSFATERIKAITLGEEVLDRARPCVEPVRCRAIGAAEFRRLGPVLRSEEHTSELQSLRHLVCRLLLEK